MKKNCQQTNNNLQKKAKPGFWRSFALVWRYYKVYVLELVLIFILSLISSAISIGCAIGMQFAFQEVGNNFTQVSIICGSIIGVYLCDWVILLFQYRLCVSIGEKLAMRLRNDLFHKLNSLSIFYYDTNKTGDIMSKFTNDINNISMLISNNMADIIGCTIWIVGLSIGMLIISPTLTLITFFFFAGMVLVIVFFVKKSSEYFANNQRMLGSVSSFLQEKILGQSIIDIYNEQDNVFDEFKKINKELTSSNYKSQYYGGGSIPFLLGLINIATVAITVAGILIILSGNTNAFAGITLPTMNGQSAGFMTLTIFMLMARQFYSPLVQVTNVMNLVLSAQASIHRLEPIFNEPSEFNDYEKIIVAITFLINKDNLDQNIKYLQPQIEFKDVNFGYNPDKLILENINLKINKGDFIGIVGPTGSGKTTLVNLISKFYEISSGEILIDGTSIKEMEKNSLRKNISMVLQDNFLFEISIRDNLKIVNPNVTDEEIEKVTKLTECYDVIMKLPQGFDTVISNDSDMLSKGEKQLIAIARAVLANNDLLILDEATSSVDTKTEKRIQAAMMNVIKNKTSIMIAHRLSTIRDATKIVVIKDGRIIETGNHDELLKQNGFYAKLYNSQLNIIE